MYDRLDTPTDVTLIMKLVAALRPLPAAWLDEKLARSLAYERAGLEASAYFDQKAIIYERARRRLFPDDNQIENRLRLANTPVIPRHAER